ncbi:xanthine dehydrogenase/oxidase-like [Physella acuta]|uniref:xanthine dehydrogenase/oxidase-like n=1 Tax=Physella acuta TaxID=109671 RepID=UPI0027DC5F5D|nr:xanthine dehydrogenase/oxidase-like [Physella acuta]
MSTNIKFNSKRFPIYVKYKAGCGRDGKLQAIVVDIFVDAGVRPTPMVFDLVPLLDAGYFCPNWQVRLQQMRTNKAVGAATRGPGAVPAALIMETVLEHLAKELNWHPVLFKEVNIYQQGQVAQAVAHTLRISLDFIKVRPNQNNVTANAWMSGYSTTSERCVGAAIEACHIINERLAPLREKLPDASWTSLVSAAYLARVELQATNTHFHHGDPTVYFTYMTGAVETEVDVLTGEYLVKRVDIMADIGDSMNPTIDIGQIEGAFVMGLGAYLLENVLYDSKTGTVINDSTWEYKPPTTKDIPIDWRIHLLPDAPNAVGIVSSKAVGEPPHWSGCRRSAGHQTQCRGGQRVLHWSQGVHPRRSSIHSRKNPTGNRDSGQRFESYGTWWDRQTIRTCPM